MLINKDSKSNQTCYENWVVWTNSTVPGTSFAERHEILCKNWIDTHGKSYAKQWWDDVTGKSLLSKIDTLEKRLAEVEQNGRQ